MILAAGRAGSPPARRAFYAANAAKATRDATPVIVQEVSAIRPRIATAPAYAVATAHASANQSRTGYVAEVTRVTALIVTP